MIPYLSTYMTILACSLFNMATKQRRRKICYFICVIAIVSLLALRHLSMGVDLGNITSYGYLHSFDQISCLSWSQVLKLNSFLNYEKGFVIFNKLVSSILNNKQFYLAVCAIVSLLPIFIIIYKRSKLPFLSIIIYLGLPCFLLNFSGLRQAIAIGIVFSSMLLIQRKKLLLFVAIILFASTFHFSAILFLLAYPVYYFKQTKLRQVLSVLLVAVVYIFRTQLLYFLSRLLKKNAVPDNNGAVTLFVVFVAIYIFCLIFGNQSNRKLVGYQNLFLLACLCQAFGGTYMIAIRVGYYFMISLTLLLPLVLTKKNIETEVVSAQYIIHKQTVQPTPQEVILCVMVAVCFGAFGLYSIYTSTWAEAYPYYFFWR